jgi:hypothetical protein
MFPLKFSKDASTYCILGVPRVTPYVAVPDPADCSAFWLRICLADFASLHYVLCPGEMKYFSSKNSLTCYNQGSVHTTACSKQYNLHFFLA